MNHSCNHAHNCRMRIGIVMNTFSYFDKNIFVYILTNSFLSYSLPILYHLSCVNSSLPYTSVFKSEILTRY